MKRTGYVFDAVIGLLVVFLAAYMLGLVRYDSHPFGVSVGTDTRYCSVDLGHVPGCEVAR